MDFQQIRPQKIYEKIAEQIKEMIISGKLQPGEKLPSVNELSEQFQVGRSAVREALSALQAMGLIELKQGEGTFVRHISPSDILGTEYPSYLLEYKQLESMLEVRKIIESSAGELAAIRRDEQDLLNLQDALAKMEENIEANSYGEEPDWLFHYAIVKATKNDLLIYIIETISDSIKRNLKESRIISYKQEGMAEKLLNEHREIYKAINNRDAMLAKELLHSHLLMIEENIKKLT